MFVIKQKKQLNVLFQITQLIFQLINISVSSSNFTLKIYNMFEERFEFCCVGVCELFTILIFVCMKVLKKNNVQLLVSV